MFCELFSEATTTTASITNQGGVVSSTSTSPSASVRFPQVNLNNSPYSSITHAVNRPSSSNGGFSNPTPSTTTGRRWIPPSSLRKDERPTRYSLSSNVKTDQNDARNNIIFRNVRGILNKLTPEKFEKLVNDILGVGLDSTGLLKGVILLIFEKALDEPKYSSMYAQLCKRLAEEAPNFDPPDKPCTFKRLLLNMCKDEFENRAHLYHEYEKIAATKICNDEEEAKYVAKRKMLGNIKFIGELGKLQIIQDAILLKCCEELLVGRKKQPISDQAEDLECLCYLMKTCGRILDTPKAKSLMDQYFRRLQKATENELLPIRIRFIIQDVIDLRRNKWQTRRVGKGPEGPRTIQQVREDAARDGCIYMPQDLSPTATKPSSQPFGFANPLDSGNFFDSGSKHQGPDTLFGSSSFFGASSKLYTGGTIGSYEDSNDSFLKDENFKDRGTESPNKVQKKAEKIMVSDEPVRKPSYDLESTGKVKGGESNHRHYSDKHISPPQDFGNRFTANRTREWDRKQDRYRRNDNSHRNGHNENGISEDRHHFRGDRGSNDHFQGFKHENNRSSNGEYERAANSKNRYIHPNQRDYGNHGAENEAGDVAPRFRKMNFNQTSQSVSTPFAGAPNLSVPPPNPFQQIPKDVEVALRPQQARGSLLFKPKTPSMLPKSALSRAPDAASPLGENSLLAPPTNHIQQRIMQQKEANIIIKQGAIHGKSQKDKKASVNQGPTREEVFVKVDSILDEHLRVKNVSDAVENWKSGDWLPSKMVQTAVTRVFKTALEKTDNEKDDIFLLMSALVADGSIDKMHCVEAFNKIVSATTGFNENDSGISYIAVWSISEKIHSVGEVADLLQGGSFHPAFILALKALRDKLGSEKVMEDFEASSVNLMDQLPVAERTDSNLAETLKKYELSFLMPMLAIRQEMSSQLASTSDPAAFQKWIEGNVDAKYYAQVDFILALFDVVLKFIIVKTTYPLNADTSIVPDKNLVEAEKELLTQFQTVLRKFIQERHDLQLTAVYALQVLCNEMNFPKGMLLRLFVNCYDLDIMDENAFLQWKENVNDNFTGKGKALFQVNQWLTWLEEAESDDEEEEDDDE